MIDLVVDCDTGIDDALMLLYLAASPEATIVAAGSVHGNVPAERGALNTRYVLDLSGLDKVPVAIGCRRPIAQPLRTEEWVHGPAGLGSVVPPTPRNALSQETAVEQMIRLARGRPGQLTLLASAPLTNLGAALLVEPRLPELIRRVVIMGGAIAAPGNVTPLAESNIFHDPEAADLVFQAGWGITLVPLDVTMQTILQGEYLHRLARASENNERAHFAWEILQHYLEVYERLRGVPGAAMHDPLAGGIALDPSLASYIERPVRVALRGEETRGMTIVDRRAVPAEEDDRPDVSIAMNVDSDQFLGRLVQRIAD